MLEVITGIVTTRIPNLFKDMYELRLLYSLDWAQVPEKICVDAFRFLNTN